MITAGYMGAVSVVTTVKWFWFLFGMVRAPPHSRLQGYLAPKRNPLP